MTTTESSAVKDFVLARPENMATALAVYKSWPAIAAPIKRDFLKLIHDKLKKDADLPEDTEVYCDYGEKLDGSYIYVTRKNWLPYRDSKGQEKNTAIYMQAVSKSGTNWDIGVFSVSTDDVDEEDKERRQRLQNAFADHGGQLKEWPWWEWIEDEYRDWDALLPRLHQECQAGGGEITSYFVEKFKKVFDWAAPIIGGSVRWTDCETRS